MDLHVDPCVCSPHVYVGPMGIVYVRVFVYVCILGMLMYVVQVCVCPSRGLE